MKKIFYAALGGLLALVGLGLVVPFLASIMTNPVYSATPMSPTEIARGLWSLDTNTPQPLSLGTQMGGQTSGWRFTLESVTPEQSARFTVQYGTDAPKTITVGWDQLAWALSSDNQTSITWNLRSQDDPQYRVALMATCMDYGSPWYYTGCQQWGTSDLTPDSDATDYLIRNISSAIVTLTEQQHQEYCT